MGHVPGLGTHMLPLTGYGALIFDFGIVVRGVVENSAISEGYRWNVYFMESWSKIVACRSKNGLMLGESSCIAVQM